MALEKHTTLQLKKYNKILLGIGIAALIIMCFVLGIAIYQLEQGQKSILIYLVPTVMGPLAMIPIFASVFVSSEIKKRGG